MAFIITKPLVWGLPELKPILGLPAGSVRLCFRHDAVAKAFIRTADGIRCFMLRDQGEHWEPGPEIGCNLRR